MSLLDVQFQLNLPTAPAQENKLMVPTAIVLFIIQLVQKYGGDAAIFMVNKAYGDRTEISLEDLKNLENTFKDPRSYFNTSTQLITEEEPQVESKE